MSKRKAETCAGCGWPLDAGSPTADCKFGNAGCWCGRLPPGGAFKPLRKEIDDSSVLEAGLERCIEAAVVHGEVSAPAHEAGDLGDMLRRMWLMLPAAARREFLAADETLDHLDWASGESK